MTRITNALGHTTDYEYGPFRRVEQMIAPDPDGEGPLDRPITRYSFDPAGHVTSVQDPLGRATEFVHDRAGRQTHLLQPAPDDTQPSPIFVTQYDRLDRVVATIDPMLRTTNYEYDLRSRPIKTISPDPDGPGPLGRPVTQAAYYANGLVKHVRDPLGRTTQYNYDALNRLTDVTLPDPDGAGPLTSPITIYHYDNLGRTDWVQDPRQNKTWFTYDSNSRLVQTKNALLDVASIVYDLAGRMISQTDELGRVTSYVYTNLPGQGERITVIAPDPDGAGPQSAPVTQTTTDLLGRVETVVDPRQVVTRWYYDSLGRPIQRVDVEGRPEQVVTQWTYDAVKLYASTDIHGFTTQIFHDRLNRPTRTIDPNNQSTWTTYDQVGNVTQVTYPDPYGAGPRAAPSTLYTYNAANWLTMVSAADPDGNGPLTRPETQYVHDLVGNVTSVIDPLGRITHTEFDNLDRPISVTEAAGTPLQRSTSHRYDANSNLWETTDPAGLITRWVFDPLNRPSQVTVSADTPFARTTSTQYDQVGNVTRMVDPLGHATRFEFDGLDRRIKTIDALNGETHFTYDLAGNLTGLRDPAINWTTWEFDALGRVIRETDALGQSRTFGVDVAGNRTWSVDRNGRARWFQYDPLGQLAQEIWTEPDGMPVRTLNFTRNALGELTAASDPDSAYSYGYDDLGRLVTASNAGTPDVPTVMLTQTWNAAGERTSVAATINGQADFTNSYQRDALGRVQQIVQLGESSPPGGGVAPKRVDIAYNQVDQFTSLTRYGDLAGTQKVATTSFVYEPETHRLGTLTHKDALDQVFAQYGYVWDNADRLAQWTTPDGTTTYTHDDTDQLLTADHSARPDENYTYDPNGNRTLAGYASGAGNRLLSDGTYNYEYDAEGNRTRRTHLATGQVEDYEWDYRNRLVKVTEREPQGNIVEVVEFAYDVFDRRIAKTIDADGDGPGLPTAVRFVYDGAQVALQFDDAGSLTNRFLWGPHIDHFLADEQVGSQVLWTLTDHLGSVRDVVNASGGVVKHVAYDSFGNIVADTNPALRLLSGYTGREFETEIGLQYNRARWYDPRTGQFVAVDPIKDGLNWYGYVSNRPLTSTDPSGLLEWADLAWAGGPLWALSAQSARYVGAWVQVRNQGARAQEIQARMGVPQMQESATVGRAAGELGESVGSGLKTGTKANFNAACDTLVSLGTLGMSDSKPGGWWPITEDDLIGDGYQWSYGFGRAGSELGVGIVTGSAKGVGYVGKGITALDVAGNVGQFGRGGYDIAENGLDVQNGLQAAAVAGLTGNFAGVVCKPRAEVTAKGVPAPVDRGVPHPSTPVGRSGQPLGSVSPNQPTTIGGRPFSGHAIDQMQARGIPPSVVENTIQHGVPFPANTPGTVGYYDAVNNVRVITNSTTGNVITVIPGPP